MNDEDSKKDCEHLAMPQSVPRGLLRHLIPRLLKDDTMTGAQIMQELSDRTGGEWQPSPGTIYPLLSSLEEDGFIEIIRIRTNVENSSLIAATYNINCEYDSEILPHINQFYDLTDDKFTVTMLRFATVFGLSPRMRFDLAVNGMVLGFYKINKSQL